MESLSNAPKLLSKPRNDARVKAGSRSLFFLWLCVYCHSGSSSAKRCVPLAEATSLFRGGRGGEEGTRGKEKKWMRRRRRKERRKKEEEDGGGRRRILLTHSGILDAKVFAHKLVGSPPDLGTFPLVPLVRNPLLLARRVHLVSGVYGTTGETGEK